MNPLISVIIPVYNTACYLERCIESITNNTYKNLEIICINDGSKDNSLELLSSLAQKDSRIIIIDKENEGVSVARNEGIKRATGEFISFIDSDDWIHPKYFEILYNGVLEKNWDIVMCDYEPEKEFQPFPNIKDYNLTSQNNLFETSFVEYIWGKLYRADIIKKYTFPKGIKIAEDTFYNVSLIASQINEGINFTAGKATEKLYYYFYREDSALQSIPHFMGALDLAKKYQELSFKMQNPYIKSELLERSFKSAFQYRYLQMFLLNYKSIKKETMDVLNKNLKEMRKINVKGFLKYFVLSKFPFVYRSLRIATDRTMLDWERQQRKINKSH